MPQAKNLYWRLSFTFVLLLGTLGCSKFSAINGGSVTQSGWWNTPLPGSPISGKYCTTWSELNETWAGNQPPIQITCLNSNNQWVAVGGFPESPPTSGEAYYRWPSLSTTPNGDVLLSYIRRRTGAPDEELMVNRYNATTGWTQVNEMPANTAPPNKFGDTLLPSYSQYGGQVFQFQNLDYLFWTQPQGGGQLQGGVLSQQTATGWNQIPIAPSLGTFFRFPNVLISADGKTAYLYYGEPTPTVWEFDGTNLISLGGPSVTSSEWTLQSALTEYNGGLALAYTSDNFPVQQSWATTTSVTKIAVYNGQTWSLISNQIEDTPGHDSSVPFLFTDQVNLYVIYADYTTDGVPTVCLPRFQIEFHFRVKMWNGSSWTPVGQESPTIYYSQRHEFFDDNGNVLVNVVTPDAAGTGSQQVVLEWTGSQFVQLGNVIQSYPDQPYLMIPRPGAVIKLL